MDAYQLSRSDERLSELMDRVESGESIEIEREGCVVARLVPVAVEPAIKKPFDLVAYYESIKDMPVCPGNSVVDMRKEARY